MTPDNAATTHQGGLEHPGVQGGPKVDANEAIPKYSSVTIAEALGQFPPTPQQQAVIEAPLKPLLVVAGAGSGKTETMAARVVWLVANNLVEPQQVLGLTFTRKAAGELSDRIAARLRTLAHSGLWTPRPVDAGGGVDADGGADAAGGVEAGGMNGEKVPQSTAPDEIQLSADMLPTVSTYHSFAGSIVRDHGLRLGIEPDARLLSQAASWQYAHQIVTGWDGDLGGLTSATSTLTSGLMGMSGELAEHLRTPDDVREFYADVESHLESLPFAPRARSIGDGGRTIRLAEQRHLELLPLVERYQELKKERSSLDFADQVAFAAKLSREFPRVGLEARQRFRMVLLDEFQDTSEAQIAFLAALFAPAQVRRSEGPNAEPVAVTAVGDPHQSIFSWRGASASTLSKFAREFALPGDQRTPVASLSTSWRNDEDILAAANVTADPLSFASKVEVERLTARPGAGNGEVSVARYETSVEEAQAVVDWIAQVRERNPDVTAAVLCRKRSQFAEILESFAARNIPAEAVGLGGLLMTPEVVDLVSLLWVVDDPSRGDKFMRLLTHGALRLGPADIAALHEWAKELHQMLRAQAEQYLAQHGLAGAASDLQSDYAGDSERQMHVETEDSPASPERSRRDLAADTRDEVSLIEAIGQLPPSDWRGRDGQMLSDAARARLDGFNRSLERLRALSGLPLADFVGEAERVLGLDIEVLARPGFDDPSTARAHLDAFADVAGTFSAQADRPTLGGFLEWLEAAEREERGLEMPAIEVNSRAVQVMTVHASKGLEWDIVAVPGLNQGAFPSLKSATAWKNDAWVFSPHAQETWLTGFESIPYLLRGDADDLPHLDIAGCEDTKELTQRWTDFKNASIDKALADERRLAYVAFTRARRAMLLTSSVWTRETDKPRLTSVFVDELVQAHEAGQLPLRRGPWAELPVDDSVKNPLSEQGQTMSWPHDPMRHVREALGRGPELVTRARGRESTLAPGSGVLALPGTREDRDLEVQLLLAERDRQRQRGVNRIVVPAHLSTSALVNLHADPQAFATALRRPMPSEPAVAARRGTAFHSWVEQHYASAALVDVTELPGFDDETAPGNDADERRELQRLQKNFLASEWADRTPVAVEVSLETVISGFAIRGRVDAVFARQGGGFTIVDWKTGRPPGPDAMAHRVFQLGSYAVAYARLHSLPEDAVDGAFFYAATGETVRPQLPGSAEIASVLENTVTG